LPYNFTRLLRAPIISGVSDENRDGIKKKIKRTYRRTYAGFLVNLKWIRKHVLVII